MAVNDQELYEKFKKAIIANLNRDQVIDFFASLEKDECDRLVDIFTSNDFPEISQETKAKILLVLQQLKEAVASK